MSKSQNKPKAVVLVSGGLDSATVCAIARQQGYDIYAISFNYGQRHLSEITASKRVAALFNAKDHRVMEINLGQLGGSALTDEGIDVPVTPTEGIPVTYVPARNTVFLSFALAYAEVVGASDIFIGVNSVDYSGYPDCRIEYIKAFENMANLATKSAIEGEKVTIHTPLLTMSKADIVTEGTKLGVDYSITVSCYSADEEGLACGVCDSCRLRSQGFSEANLTDPTRYIK